MGKILIALSMFSMVMGASALSARADEKPPKELVEDLSKRAYDGLIAVKNAEGEHIVKPEDAKKLKHPMISYEEREMAVARGYLSGSAHWCGLDWAKDYFKPYMNALQKEHGKKWTPYQYAYAEVLHGLSMSVAEQGKKDEKCSDTEKKRIAGLAKK